MRTKKSFVMSLITSIIFVIIGLFLFIKPDTTIVTISYLFGGALALLGLINVVKYFLNDFGVNPFDFNLVYGVLLIIGGLFLILKPNLLASLLPIILGIWIVINGVTKFQYALILKGLDKDDWKYTLLIAILTLAWGIILLVNPLEVVLKATQIIGVFIIIYAVLDIIDSFILKRNQEDINRAYIIKK